MMEVLLDLNRRGHTLIIATHDAHVAGYARRVVEIEDGRVIKDEETEGGAPAPRRARRHARAASVRGRGGAWPRLIEAMKMAWFALLGQRLRTGLTLLGVIIGIVSVVMMVALGESSQRVLQEELKDMPANFLEIAPGKFFGDPDAAKTQVSRPPTSTCCAGKVLFTASAPRSPRRRCCGWDPSTATPR